MTHPKILNIMLSRGQGGIEQAFVNMANLIHDHTPFDQLTILDVKSPLTLPESINQKRLSQFADWDPVGLFKLYSIIKSAQPDIILCHGNRPLKMVLTLRKTGLIREKIVGFCHNYSIKHLLKADAVIAVSRHMITQNLVPAGYPADNTFHLPNMIDLTSITSVELKPICDVPVIGTMGRFVGKKGFEDFIQAISLLRDQNIPIKAIIGGTGPDDNKLRSLVADLNLTDYVDFVGWVRDKRAFYDRLNFFCIPSRDEPFGIIALDTLAHGCPMIATSSKGLAEFLTDNETAFMCKPSDPVSLADVISYALKTQASQLTQMQLNGLELVKKYDIKTISESFNQIITRLI